MAKKQKQDEHAEVIRLIKDRSCLKRNVFENMLVKFEELKVVLQEYTEELKKQVEGFDSRIRVSYIEKSPAEVHLVVAGDVIIFHMHTNVFIFDRDHYVWKSSYLQDNEKNAYVGTIQIFNFLRDSIKFNRAEDVGFMIARIFINHEDHYFVEGKRELGYKFNDFVSNTISKADWLRIIDTCVQYTLEFNLLVPPYKTQQFLTVAEVVQQGQGLSQKTQKTTLGFQFSKTEEDPT